MPLTAWKLLVCSNGGYLASMTALAAKPTLDAHAGVKTGLLLTGIAVLLEGQHPAHQGCISPLVKHAMSSEMH